MITLICYFYMLLWGVDVNKEGFAVLSTFEFGGELLFLLFMSPIIIEAIMERKRR